MIGRLLSAWLALGLLSSAPIRAESRTVNVEGAAPVSGDLANARRAAIGDALRQALAAGGMDVEARTFVDRGIIRSDSLWATARARITEYQLTDEWQDAGQIGRAHV